MEDKKEESDLKEQTNNTDLNIILNNLNIKELWVGMFHEKLSQVYDKSKLCDYSIFSNISKKTKSDMIYKLCTSDTIINKCVGCMYGMGIGDATGAPLEFVDVMSVYQKKKNNISYFSLTDQKWYNENNRFHLKRGQWTDDAAMGLCMADSLIINKKYNGSDIRIRFWNWWRNGYNNAFRNEQYPRESVGLGSNISNSIYSMKDKVKPLPIYDKNTNDSGNGSIMRLCPIPIYYYYNIEKAIYYSKQSSFTTHPGYIAAETCAFMAYIIVNAINYNIDFNKKNQKSNFNIFSKQLSPIQRFLDNIVAKYVIRIENELNDIINEKENELKKRKIYAKECIIRLIKSNENNKSKEICWNWKSKCGKLRIDTAMKNRGLKYNGYDNDSTYFGSFCVDGLAMALHSLYHTNSIGTAIEMAVNMLGDADSTGSVVGQMAGAFYGFNHSLGNDKSNEKYLLNLCNEWDDFDFGLRGVLLPTLGYRYQENDVIDSNL